MCSTFYCIFSQLLLYYYNGKNCKLLGTYYNKCSVVRPENKLVSYLDIALVLKAFFFFKYFSNKIYYKNV